MRVLAENKKAHFNFEILEKFEAGISLLGQEVKSLKAWGTNLAGTYVVIKGEEAFWVGQTFLLGNQKTLEEVIILKEIESFC